MTEMSSHECNFMKPGVLQNRSQVFVFTPLPHPETLHVDAQLQRVALLSLPAWLSLREDNKETVTYRKSNFNFISHCPHRFGAALTGKPDEPL